MEGAGIKVSSQTTAAPEITPRGVFQRPRVTILLLVAAWFGILAGLIEGCGLLGFQKINWARWGMEIHVSWQILWISPLVDLILFLLVALVISVAGRLWPRLPVFRATIFALISLTLYDWLLVPNRLYHIACLLFAAGVATVLSGRIAGSERSAVRFWRQTLPGLVALAVLVFAVVQGGPWFVEHEQLAKLPPPEPGSPNVLLIIVDTLRADHVSAYGYSRPTTPNIDRLAQQGVLFENAVSAASWTYPSHVSLMTGKYPSEDGLGRVPPMSLWHSNSDLIRNPMIGEELEKRGYRTGAFSGNRIYFDHDLGFGRGFLHFEDYFFSPSDMLFRTVFGKELSRWCLSRGRAVRILQRLGLERSLDLDAEGSGERWSRVRSWDSHPPRKRGQEINREVLRWIGKSPQAHPFFAVLNYFDVHASYGGPPSYPKPAWGQSQDADKYDDGVKYVDDCIGQLMAELRSRHFDQNTLLVITADHGESLGEHGLATHAKSLYWDLIHVPLLFWYPGHVPSGIRIPNVVSTSFLASTLTSWLPGTEHIEFPGPSLAGLWEGSGVDSSAYYPLAELSYNCFRADLKLQPEFSVATDLKGGMKSIVTDRWHLLKHKTFGDQLYDWRADPQETHNLVDTLQGRQIAQDLLGRLFSLFIARREKPNGAEEAARLNPDGNLRAGLTHHAVKATRVNDYYLLHASGGAAIRVDVQAVKSDATRQLDPVIAVENAEGMVLESCRNPGDDSLSAPGISDPTPDAFDDTCVNDDVIPGVESASRLEILVPGTRGAPVDLYLRVSDWNRQSAIPAADYEIAVKQADATGFSDLPQVPSKAMN